MARFFVRPLMGALHARLGIKSAKRANRPAVFRTGECGTSVPLHTPSGAA